MSVLIVYCSLRKLVNWNLIGGMISTLCHRCLAGMLRCEMIDTNHLDLSSLDV